MTSYNSSFNDGDIGTRNNSHQIQCSCHNISIKIQSVQRDQHDFSSKPIIFDSSDQKSKHHKHIYTIGYKSIRISDFSAAMVKQSVSSQFHITCLDCQNDFLVHSYGNNAIVKRLKNNYSRKSSYDENEIHISYNEKKTMKYFFPLELRKFCTFGYDYYDQCSYQDYEKSRDNEKENKSIEYQKKFIQGLETNSSFEKETKKIENSFDDPFGAVFLQDIDPIVGPYTASPVLNWNATNSY